MRELIRMIRDEKRSVKERMFLLLSSAALMAILFAIVGGIIIGERIEDITILIVGFILFLALTVFAIKSKRLNIVSVIASLFIIIALLPLTFFAGGGINGGSPLWFLFCIIFISMLVEGKIKYFLLILNCLSALFCYITAYKHPWTVMRHSTAAGYADSFTALIFTSIMLCFMVSFELRITKRQKELADEKSREIEALNESQNRFFSSLSHEIRTPINTIIGLNEMILRENASKEINEDALNIKAASKMLLHLINEILDMSKFESGEMRVNAAPYHTGEMLSDVVGMVWIRAREKKLEFKVDVSPDLPEGLMGDEVRIKQVLLNLLTNALKYTSEGTVKLQIQCERMEGNIARVIYTVSDTGMGIKRESLPYLFTAFKRIDEDKNRYIEGTGLGLAIVKQFVDLMGGRINVNSVYSRGSTFIVEIPQPIVNDEHIGEINMEEREEGNHEVHVTSFEAPKARILVVDDTEANLMVVEKLLRDTKVTIDTASSGREALSLTLDNPYQVIFMDHMMPEMDGVDCMHAIKKQTGGMSRDSKIVALTANAGVEIEEMYEREGFDGYVVKPVTGEELEHELFRLLPKEMVIVTGTEEELAEESMAWVRDHKKKINVAITTESVADLPTDILEAYGIATIPHKVQTDGGIFKDGKEIETRGLLNYIREGKGTVKTLPPGIEEHEAFFADQLDLANNIIHITLSDKVGNSGYPAAKEAAANFDNVFIVDSGHLSGGQGLMVLEAARLASLLKTPEEIIDSLERMREHIHTSFIVDDPSYLVKAGQLKEWASNFAHAFMLRPVLSLIRGRIRVVGGHLGTRESAWEKYVKSAFRVRGSIDKRLLLVIYVGLSTKDLRKLEEMIKSRMDFEEIRFHKGSASIAVNSGPRSFGLLFFTKY